MRSRVLTAVAAALAAPLLIVALIGLRSGPGALVAVLAVAVLLGALFRRGTEADVGAWSRPLAPPPTAVARPDRGSPTNAFAAVESRELLLSPGFAVGAGITLVLIAVLGWGGAHDYQNGAWDGPWQGFYENLLFGLHPLLAFMTLATHFAVTRSRRHGCDEFFDACPLTRSQRFDGHLRTAVAAAGLAAAGAALFAGAVLSGHDSFYGPVNAALVPCALTLVVLAAGAVAIGVATGRWAPWGISPILAVVAVLAISSALGDSTEWLPRRYLATAQADPPLDFIFIDPRPWGRLIWLTAMTVLIASVVFVTDRRAGRLVAVGAAAAAVITAVVVAQPMSDARARAAAALITDPLNHQRCRDVGGLDVCSYEQYPEVAARAAEAVRPVLAAAPPGVLDGVLFMQFPPHADALPPEVVDETNGRRFEPAGTHDLGFGTTPADLAALRLRVAALAVGAPAEPSEKPTPANPTPTGGTTVLAGQARGVIMLWLAARGMDLNEGLRLAPDIDPAGGPTLAGMSWPTECGRGGSVIWSRQDFRAARMLMRAEDARVRSVVLDQWDRVVDPITTTDELLTALGMRPVGPPDPGIEAAQYSC